MEKDENIENISITIKKLLNLDNFKLRLIRGGINIIVGENNTGKTKLLDFIYYENEKWYKLNEEYKNHSNILPIFFRSFSVFDPSSKYASKEEKGKLKCSYELYYFDLKSSIPFLIKKKGEIDKEIEFENIKERDCVFYKRILKY